MEAAVRPQKVWRPNSSNSILTLNSEKKENSNEKDDVVDGRIDSGHGLRHDGQ
jgi:endo-1,4-beta-D-glucanase Y